MSDSSDIAGRSRSLVRLRPLRFSLPVRTIARSALGWIVPLIILLAWEAASRARLVAPNLLPPPSAVLGVAIELARLHGRPAQRPWPRLDVRRRGRAHGRKRGPGLLADRRPADWPAGAGDRQPGDLRAHRQGDRPHAGAAAAPGACLAGYRAVAM